MSQHLPSGSVPKPHKKRKKEAKGEGRKGRMKDRKKEGSQIT